MPSIHQCRNSRSHDFQYAQFVRRKNRPGVRRDQKRHFSISGFMTVVVSLLAAYLLVRAGILLSKLSGQDLTELAIGAGSTFLRVTAALAIGALWTIPACSDWIESTVGEGRATAGPTRRLNSRDSLVPGDCARFEPK
jgi:hypothetical protein